MTALASALVSIACSGKAIRTSEAEPSSAGTSGASSVGGQSAMGSGGSFVAVGGSAGKGSTGGSVGTGGVPIHPPFDGVPPEFDGIETCVAGTTTATLSWSPAHDQQTSDDHIVYLVYVTKVGEPLGEPVATLLGATVHTVAGLDSNTHYSCTVQALDQAQNITATSNAVEIKTLVSLSLDVQPIFFVNCAKSSCHLGENAFQGLRLEEEYAFAHTVNVPSVWPTEQNPNWGVRLDRVEPYDPEMSFLWHKVAHTGLQSFDPETMTGWALGSTEPKDIAPAKLPEEQLQLIYDWISEGAFNN